MKKSIYIYLAKTQIKDTSGHILNKYQCKKCGKIVIKRKGFADETYNCHHLFNQNTKLNHEEKNEKLYRIFMQMKNRCYNQKCKDYKNYGNKGIKICNEWLKNYYNFQYWAINNGYEEGLTIDRINSNKDYEPNNCRWITKNMNSKFKGNTNNIIVYEITNSGRGWAKVLNKGQNYINQMLKRKGLEKTIEYIKNELNNRELVQK